MDSPFHHCMDRADFLWITNQLGEWDILIFIMTVTYACHYYSLTINNNGLFHISSVVPVLHIISGNYPVNNDNDSNV